MHIALLTDGITPYVTGGMQRHSFHLARHLLSLGVELTLIHSVPNGCEIPSQLEVQELLGVKKGKLHVFCIPFPKSGKIPGHYIKESYRFSESVYEIIKPHLASIDFVYAKGFSAWRLLEAKKKGEHLPPVGVKFHGYEMFQKAHRLKQKLEQFMLKPPVIFNSRNADAVFSYGGEITNIIKRIGVEENHIVEIGSGVDESWMRTTILPQFGKRKFLFVGRSEARKGIADLERACDALVGKGVEMHWVGPIEPAFPSDGMHFYHGPVTDSEKMKEVIDQCQVLVVPSHSEGMPNVILEGMARGLAIIATRVGAVPKMVSSANGELVEPKSIDELREVLGYFTQMTDGALDEIRANSLAIARVDFNWENVARLTLDAIKKITFSNAK